MPAPASAPASSTRPLPAKCSGSCCAGIPAEHWACSAPFRAAGPASSNRRAGSAPSAHAGEYAAERARTEALLAQLTQQIDALKAAGGNGPAIADCKAERRRLSRALTARIHKAYRFENFLGEILPLTEVDTGSPRPPTGMGDCCAPKLLQHAVRHRLEPLGMVEFWWGQSPRTLPRVEGAYYGSCTHKCYPILGFLLRGCDAAAVGP